MARIKICGLRRTEDIEYVNRLRPDYVGFILSGGFKRSIDTESLSGLVQRLSGNIKKVGVFVDEPFERIDNITADGLIDIIQLHGNESPEYCRMIKAPVIKVLKPDAFDKARDYEQCVDYFLFDSGTGSGKSFEWEKIPTVSKPFFLAGGLNSNNLTAAIKKTNPYAVDLSSSVETDGYKDYDKIKEVIRIARGTINE